MTITIQPAWTFTNDAGEKVDSNIFILLRAVHDTGRLTLAAHQANLSYRHAWDLLKKWSQFFGSSLVEMRRGKGASLSALGEKLLWAEQRCNAGLFPQLRNIASDLNREIGQAMKQSKTIVRVHASHGYAVEKLAGLMEQHGHAQLDLQYMGSVVALESLCRSNCDLAGFHLPLEALGERLRAPYAEWLKPRQHRIIRLVRRTQGLIVPKGNPLNISSLVDLTRPGIRFVNRQRGSGTRILLDGLLEVNSVDKHNIRGYETSEFTHAAVAAFIASGMADVGFGIAPAAHQFKLDFLPVAQERYMFACHKEALSQASVIEVTELLKGDTFRSAIDDLPGYELDCPGEILSVEQAFSCHDR